jgi:hypothetical protein
MFYQIDRVNFVPGNKFFKKLKNICILYKRYYRVQFCPWQQIFSKIDFGLKIFGPLH